jgi:hypothetical protein
MPLLILATLFVWGVTLWCVVRLVRGPELGRRVRALLGAIAGTSLGSLLIMLLVVIRAFQSFSGETLVARITMRKLAPHEFELTYAPSDVTAPVITVPLRGDQWAVSGGIIKWHRWLTALGLRSYHRPTRLAGQFSSLAKQRAQPPTVYAIADDRDWMWERVYWIAPYLPLIDAAYGSSAYVYMEPRATFELYVTPSGYLVKRRPIAS